MRQLTIARNPNLTLAPVLALALALALTPAAQATNGYFTHGYGTAAKGLAGAGVALPMDAMAAATNPAGLAFVEHRYDAGVAFFNPNREYEVSGAPSRFPGTFGLTPGRVESDSEHFQVPFFGGVWKAGEKTTYGAMLYGHGGMNTDYPTGTFFGSSPTGVDMSQLFIAATWARRLGAAGRHAVGVTPVLVYQAFEAQGVQAFGLFSSDPANLSNNGSDEGFGYGVKLGYLGKLSERFSLGVAYQTEMRMDEFDSYAGLFADRGGFDIPSSAWLGIAYHGDGWRLAIDTQEIYYSDVASVSNPMFPNLLQAPLGAPGGAGFGWQDMTIYKLGVEWDASSKWVLRAGFATGDQPIPATEVLFNILAPGVMEEHLSVGFSRQLGDGSRSLHLALTRALSSSVSGPNPLEVPGLQQIELTMDQWDLELSYSWGM